MKYCGHCGAQIADEADVCIYCKTPCQVNLLDPAYNSRKEGRQIAGVTVTVLVVALLLVACYFILEISFFHNLLSF